MRNLYFALILICSAVTVSAQSTQTFKRFTLSAQVGIGQRVGALDESLTGALKDHANALKSGTAFQLEAGYHINRDNIISLGWGSFSSSNESEPFFVFAGQAPSPSTRVETRDRISFLMANFTHYFSPAASAFRLFGQAGIGLASYRSTSEFIAAGSSRVPATVRGSGFASQLGAGAEWRFSPSVALVGQLNYAMSRVGLEADIPTVDMELEDGERENLNQIRATVGLRVFF